MAKNYFVSAYATSPSFHKWDQASESEYFQYLRHQPSIGGIEHPFLIDSEKYPLAWLKENISENWSIIITTLPTFMQAARSNPNIGIASTSEKDRISAVSIVKEVCHYTHKLNEMFGRTIVKAINLHSSPKNDDSNLRGDRTALKKSLIEIKRMDWGNTQLNIEHCDAYMPGQIAEKGFLSFKDEIEVINQVSAYGIVLNWARSAIEFRSPQGPLAHIHSAMRLGLLKGFFFSGCTDNNKSEYGCWKDTHMPPKNFIKGSYLKADSLLGFEEIKQVLTVLESHVYLGVKVLNPSEPCIKKSVGLNVETIEALNTVAIGINQNK